MFKFSITPPNENFYIQIHLWIAHSNEPNMELCRTGKPFPVHLKNTPTVFQRKEAKQRQGVSLVSPILNLLGGN